MKDLKLLHVLHRDEWRAWLADHHDRETEVWLVFYKQHTGRPRVDYGDAVEEALCFGWIDSIVRRLDDDRYAQKFTPRKPRSNWSESNLQRWAKLLRAGRIAPPGLARCPPPASPALAPSDLLENHPGPGTSAAAAAAPASPPALVVPADLEAALRAHGPAWVNFTNLAPSYRRLYVKWIEAAKRPEARVRRLAEAVDRLAQNLKLGLK
jgi:uncharacterized protein YdeI (YjbR/CyaY-like superfamily)